MGDLKNIMRSVPEAELSFSLPDGLRKNGRISRSLGVIELDPYKIPGSVRE